MSERDSPPCKTHQAESCIFTAASLRLPLFTSARLFPVGNNSIKSALHRTTTLNFHTTPAQNHVPSSSAAAPKPATPLATHLPPLHSSKRQHALAVNDTRQSRQSMERRESCLYSIMSDMLCRPRKGVSPKALVSKWSSPCMSRS